MNANALTVNPAAERIARDTYAAMLAEPPHVQLANALLRADSRTAREAALRAADPETRDAALQWLAAPAETRETERRLAWLREDGRRVAAVREHYRTHIADFIADWMMVTDSRRVARGQPALVAFTLWPKQRQLVSFLCDRLRSGEHATIVKGRDVGASTVCMATFAAWCIFETDFAAGVLSNTEAKLDRYQDTLFMKLRGLLRWLPPELAAGYDEAKTSNYLSVTFPETRSTITGATGSQAFRSMRQSVVLVDESAFLQDAHAIDAALAAVTDVRIDVSTPNGIGGSFYDRAHNPAIPRMDLTYRDDPRRDQAWYEKQVRELDPVVLAQEVLADFNASRQGVVIPAAWVQSAIGLAEKLGLKPVGARYAALDIGDTGDRSAWAGRHGVALTHVESWSGAGSDLLRTAARAFTLCDAHELDELLYDADGMGASMRGDARVLNESRDTPIKVVEYRGSASPVFPERQVPRTGRKWADLCANRKSQSWYSLRLRFEQSHRAATGETYDADAIVSIDPRIPELAKLTAELSQPTMTENTAGRLLVDKLGDSERSPNLADSVCMIFAPRQMPMNISPDVLAMVSQRVRA